jgi:hypothetical protein
LVSLVIFTISSSNNATIITYLTQYLVHVIFLAPSL